MSNPEQEAPPAVLKKVPTGITGLDEITGGGLSQGRPTPVCGGTGCCVRTGSLEKWKRDDFDIILMDLQMPEMNGIEATRAIRSREPQKGRRTCIIGAHAHLEIQEECLESGMDRVLTKPLQVEDLYTAIEGCI